jgi:hypothetical protein
MSRLGPSPTHADQSTHLAQARKNAYYRDTCSGYILTVEDDEGGFSGLRVRTRRE